MEQLVKAIDFNDFDRNEVSSVLQDILTSDPHKIYTGFLVYEDMKKWLFQFHLDRNRSPMNQKLISEMFTITETNELIRYFDEKPYTHSQNSNELNIEMLTQLLNEKGYDGILDVDEIKEWVNKHSEKNTHIWKDSVHQKVKLSSKFDPSVNKEARLFGQKHGYDKIRHIDETNIDCIMLVEDEKK